MIPQVSYQQKVEDPSIELAATESLAPENFTEVGKNSNPAGELGIRIDPEGRRCRVELSCKALHAGKVNAIVQFVLHTGDPTQTFLIAR